MSWVLPLPVPSPVPVFNGTSWSPIPAATTPKKKRSPRKVIPTNLLYFYVKYDKDGNVKSVERKDSAVSYRGNYLQFYKRVRTFGNLYVAAKDELDAYAKAIAFKQAMEGAW